MMGGEKSKKVLMSWKGPARRLAAARGLIRLDVNAAATLAVEAMATTGTEPLVASRSPVAMLVMPGPGLP